MKINDDVEEDFYKLREYLLKMKFHIKSGQGCKCQHPCCMDCFNKVYGLKLIEALLEI